MEALLIGAAGGLIVGVIILFVEYLIRHFEKKRAEANQRIVRFANEKREITGSIFNYLGPRSSIELMKSELGPPNKKGRQYEGVFSPYPHLAEVEGEPDEFNTYLYFFKNAEVKIISKDNETIDSLTVIPNFNNTNITFNSYFSASEEEDEIVLNRSIITPAMLENAEVEQLSGCRDVFTAVKQSIGNPFYVHLTYFCDYSGTDDIKENPQLLVGSRIDGICISSQRETTTYIYISDRL